MKKRNFLLTLAAGLMCSYTVSAAEYVPKILAGVVLSNEWTTTGQEGFYELEAIPGGKLTRLSKERDIYAAPLGGAVYEDGKMKGIHFRTVDDPFSSSGYSYMIYNVEYDLKTLERTKCKVLSDLYGNLISGSGMTHDPVTGKNFGIFYNFDMDYNVLDRKFCSIDFTKDIPTKNQIRTFYNGTETYCAMAAGSNGMLYVISHDGFLYSMNKNNGSTTLLGYLGVDNISRNPSSMTFDPRTQKLYWCFVDTSNRSYLYEINYTIGAVSATKIMQIPGNAYLVNMYIAPAEAADAAPAAVTDLNVDFQGESYTGNVSFTLPTLSYDGEPISGQLSYTIYADDAEIGQGTGAVGASVTKQVTVPSPGGDTRISVKASSAAGEGAPEYVDLYIGYDTPDPVANLKVDFDNSTHKSVITWTAPQAGIHGKTLSAANLTYDVVRMPDNVKVASAQSSTTFTEPLDDTQTLKSYYYTVTPTNGALYKGAAATSNKIVVGVPLNLPYSEYFTSDAGFDIFTTIDANNDGVTWKRYHQVYQYSGTVADYARMDASRDNPDDDWLLLPPLNLRKGSVYQLAFAAKKEYSDRKYDQLFEVKVGKGLNTDSYQEVVPVTGVNDVNFTDFDTEFTVEEDGVYYVAFHAVSNAASGPLDLDYVSVKELASSDAPKAVTNLVITPDPTGELTAKASFTTPSENLHGEAITSITKIEIRDEKGTLVGSALLPKVGQTVEVDMNNITNGWNTFTVTPYVDSRSGDRAQAKVFVGEDIPAAPSNIRLADNGEYAILTWDAPVKGINGQYVNPEKMKFNLGDIDEVWGHFIPLVNDIKTPYNTGEKSGEGAQTLLYYALRGETKAGLGEPAASNGLVVGAPYTLPYVMSFAESNWGQEPFVWYEGEYADWNMGKTPDISSDGDGYAFIFIPNRAEIGIFNTGKISLAGATKPVLTFDYYVYPLSSTSISVAVDKYPQGVAETLQDINFYNRSDEGWHQATVDLSAYRDEPFVIIKFAMASSSKSTPAVIDNLRVGNDTSGMEALSVDNVKAPYTVYSIDGRRLRDKAESLDGLAPGIYIVNGLKILVK